METKSEKNKENTKRENTKSANPVVREKDDDMHKPVRGLQKQ